MAKGRFTPSNWEQSLISKPPELSDLRGLYLFRRSDNTKVWSDLLKVAEDDSYIHYNYIIVLLIIGICEVAN